MRWDGYIWASASAILYERKVFPGWVIISANSPGMALSVMVSSARSSRHSVEMVGRSCVPLATIVLGLTIGSLHVQRMPSFSNISRVVLLKLIVAPMIMFAVLKFTTFSSGPLESAFWILEMSSPPATGLALQAVHFGGDEHLVCGVLVVAYLVALITMPLFFSLVRVLI